MNSRIRSLLLIALLSALTGVGSFMRVPFLPVPFTLQTLFVYLAGNLLGSKRGAVSQLLFLAIGLMGVPIFSMGGGPGYIFQPTFGYLAGFPVGAWIIGTFVERLGESRGWGKILAVNCLGFLSIFTMGVVYLYINLNFLVGTTFSWVRAIWSGMLIFLPGEIVKMFLAVALVKRLGPLMVLL